MMAYLQLLVAGPLLVASLAFATPSFTGVIQTELMMGGPPPGLCALCHVNNQTVSGTVTTPFGRTMRMQGLAPNNEASLRSALVAIEAAGTDSDMDGCADVLELRSMPTATNPNRAGDCSPADAGSAGGGTAVGGGTAGGSNVGPVRYGCGANVVPTLWTGAFLALVTLRITSARSRSRQTR